MLSWWYSSGVNVMLRLWVSPPLFRIDKVCGVRHMQVMLLFLCLIIAYSLRVNLSVAIIPMMNPAHNANHDIPVYHWDERSKALILSSFFWGYLLTQVPAGQLAERFGPHFFLVSAVAIASLFTILTPLFAELGGWGLVVASRVIQGLSQGFIYPSVHTMLAKWVPPGERGRLATYVYAGAQLGIVLTLPSCGLLASTEIGWPLCFYVFGALGLAWAVLWFFLGANSPAQHKFISTEEQAYIEESLGNVDSKVKRPTPWLSILTSVPLWALIFVHCGHNWGLWTLLTQMPTYMNDVLKFKLKSNGFLSALPYMVKWLLSFVFSWLADFVYRRQVMSVGISRKVFQTIGDWIPAMALVGVGYCDQYGAVALLTVAVGLNAATYVGYHVNHIDLSPNFAGTLMGITNTFANVMSFIGPLVVGVLVTQEGNADQWRTVFFIAAGFYFVCDSIFIIFGQGKTQAWNEDKPAAVTS